MAKVQTFDFGQLERLVLEKFETWAAFRAAVEKATGKRIAPSSHRQWKTGSCPSYNTVVAMATTLDVYLEEFSA